MYGHGSSYDAAAVELLTLQQGQWNVIDFVVNFWIVAICNGLPLGPLTEVFLHELVDLLVVNPRPILLDEVINLIIEVNQLLHVQVSPPFSFIPFLLLLMQPTLSKPALS